jgi:LPS export ABC transporter protein LptC
MTPASQAWIAAAMLFASGCGRQADAPQAKDRPGDPGKPSDAMVQQMDRFTMEGFAPDGRKRWELHGTGADLAGELVTIQHPDGIGFDKGRTAFLDARLAHVNQTTRRIRLEERVNIHTSDGLWFQAPQLYWLPDQERFTTDEPVRLETDHMLIRGRRAVGHTQLNTASILEDVEVILNPTTHELASGGGTHHVTITCDGPLTFDYEHSVAIFEKNVHVTDPQGDMYSTKLIAYMDKETRTVIYAEAIGDVRIVQGGHTAVGGRAVYEPAKGKLTLMDSPSLRMATDGSRLPMVPGLPPRVEDKTARKGAGKH